MNVPESFIEAIEKLVGESGMTQITDEGELNKIIAAIITKSPKQVEQYKGGKTNLLGFFVGQVMKETKGRAKPD